MADSKVSVGILGASGYGGAGLLRRLAVHPHVEVTGVASRQFLNQPIQACWPQLVGHFPDLTFQNNDVVIESCDVLFCATPHGATASLVKKALDAGCKVIDLSADFRLSPGEYAHWYAQHPHPELFERARYGLVELHREELKSAELIANPGCNSTTAILALAPLAAHGLLGRDTVISNASGVSGAGRSPGLGLHYPELNENMRPYKVAGTHRHIAEIEATLGRAQHMGRHLKTHEAFDKPIVTLSPHLVPMTRGILATCHTRPEETERPLDGESLLELYQTFYSGEPLISVQTDLPQTKAVYGSDRCVMSVRYDERSGQIVAMAVIDNLGKGAAGQAVHNFNLMMGFEETLGLFTQGVWP